MKPILLIDGDEYLYRATAAVEKDVRWDEQNHVLCSNSEEAWDVLTASLDRLFVRFETREHVMAFSTVDAPNFRLSIDPTYKGKRPRKPLCYVALRERMEQEFNAVNMPGLEADDVCGILATKPQTGKKRQRIIVSQDKDMKTVPSTVWNRRELATYSEAEADYWHLYQTLTGDVTDGYKGCPGVGPKKAEAILNVSLESNIPGVPFKEEARPFLMWLAVVEAYQKAGLTSEDALRNARLARILRWSDWDSETKQPKLWSPNG